MNYKLNTFSQILAAVFLIAGIAGMISCEKYSYTPEKINPIDSVRFQATIQPIFSANCLNCHGAIKAPDLRVGKSYKALTTGGYVTLPGETSKLYTKMIGPDHAPKTSVVDKQKVLIWINQGAHNN